MGPVTDLPMRWGFWLPVWTLAVLVIAISVWLTQPVAASGGVLENCEFAASAGGIDVWYCQTDSGTEFLLNSVGFMVVVE